MRRVRDWLVARYLRGREHPAKLRVVRALSRTVIPPAGVVAAVAPDLRLYLHPRDWIEYLLLRGTPYEPLTLAFLRANLLPGDGAVLAGVNFGLHVATAARAVGPGGQVVGAEPQPAALLRARANLELNGLAPRVLLVEAALGRAPGLAPMAWSPVDNPGAASLLDEGAGFIAPVVRLESLLSLLGGRPFRLLLLDVQGYEQEALAGLDLAEGPELVVLELDRDFLARAAGPPGEIAARLEAAGYSLHDLHGEDPRRRLLDLPENNLVAVRKGAAVAWGRSA